MGILGTAPLTLVALLIAGGWAGLAVRRRRPAGERTRRRGIEDPWLNRVAIAVAELGLTERARNTGTRLGGTPLLGDIAVQERFVVDYVHLFASGELALAAERGLLADPRVRESVYHGRLQLRRCGRVLHVAAARGGVVDEYRLDEIVRTVGDLGEPASVRALPAAA